MISSSLTNYLAKFTQFKRRNWNMMMKVNSHEILIDEALCSAYGLLHSLVNNISCHCSEKETKRCRVLRNSSSSQSKYVSLGHVGNKRVDYVTFLSQSKVTLILRVFCAS